MFSSIAHEVVSLEVLCVVQIIGLFSLTLAFISIWILHIHIICQVEHILNMLGLVLSIGILLRAHALELVFVGNFDWPSSIEKLRTSIW